MSTDSKALSRRSPGDRLYAHFSNALARVERRRWAFVLLLLVPLAYLTLLYAVPVLLLIAQSFLSYDTVTQRTGGFTMGNYAKILSDPAYLRVLWTSIRIGFLVTVLDIVVGYPVAYLLARLSGARKQILLAAIVSPLLVSLVIRTFSWAILLQPAGPVNHALMAIGLIQQPLQIMNREPAVVIAMVHVYLPFMIIPLSTVIESIDPTLELAASSLGANVWRRFIEVILPLSTPGIAAGCMLVLTTSVSAYVTPAMLSGNTFLVMPTLVQQQMQVLVNWSFGSAIAVELIVVVLAIVGVFSWLAESATKYRGR